MVDEGLLETEFRRLTGRQGPGAGRPVLRGAAAGLLAEGRARSADDIRELMSGNLCRCGAYANIVPAVQQAGQA